jgi:hypothetical protein
MKNRMKAKGLFLVQVILIIFFSTDVVLARVGFRGGGFHGGFGRGYHFGHYGGHGYYIPWGFWDYFFFFSFIVLVVLFFFFCTLVLWKSEFSRKVLSRITQNDSFWNIDSMKQNARKTFLKIQDAWGSRDLSSVKDLITPDLYSKFDSKLSEMKSKGDINKIKNIIIKELRIISCEDFIDDSKDRYVAHIRGSFVDYTINEFSNEIVKNPSRIRENFIYTYHFVRSNNKWLLEDIDDSVSLWDIIRLRNYKEQ